MCCSEPEPFRRLIGLIRTGTGFGVGSGLLLCELFKRLIGITRTEAGFSVDS